MMEIVNETHDLLNLAGSARAGTRESDQVSYPHLNKYNSETVEGGNLLKVSPVIELI